MSERLLTECVAYFKERSVYQVLFKKLYEKYYSLGHLGGSVTLTGLSADKKQQLSGFFQKDFTENKTITISVRLMEKALANSKFAGLDWRDILEAYHGEAFLSKKEVQLRQEEEKIRFFEQLIDEFGESPGGVWLKRCLQEKKEGYGLLMLHYRQKQEELSAILKALLAGVEKLPAIRQKQESRRLERVRIPVFAAQVSGNPHFFDQGTLAERLLIQFLRDCFPIPDASRDQLLYTAGLLRDDLSNYTLAYGVEAVDTEGNVHAGIEGFTRRMEPVQLTLLTVSRLGKVWPKAGKKVYIVENPAVFSALLEAKPDIALICGNGQIRMATFALLDLFEQEVEFWYAGDFDPEGLLIAQRLRKRYGSRLVFWKYEVSCYQRYLSDVVLESRRIKKLDKVEEEELIELKEAIKRTGRVTYQEMMIQEYLGE